MISFRILVSLVRHSGRGVWICEHVQPGPRAVRTSVTAKETEEEPHTTEGGMRYPPHVVLVRGLGEVEGCDAGRDEAGANVVPQAVPLFGEQYAEQHHRDHLRWG